jgi:hypothetical protein
MDTQSTVTSKAGVQKIGKKVSDKFPQQKDAGINLRDKLNDVLLMEKHHLMSYQIGINEIINDDLRKIVINNRNNLQQIQINFFNELFNLGEYQANIATGPQITDTVDIFTNYQAQFPLS